jgi:hypothetical protein
MFPMLKTLAVWGGATMATAWGIQKLTGNDGATQEREWKEWQAQNSPQNNPANQPYQYTTPVSNTLEPYQFGPNDDVVSLASQYNTTPQAIIQANPGGYPFSTGQNLLMPKTVQYSAPIGPQPAKLPSVNTPTPAGNTDYSRTQAAQTYARNNTPFLQQQRWDPQRQQYVSIGKLLKQGKLDLKGNWTKSSKRQRRAGNQQQKAERQQDNTLTNSFLSFNISGG